MKPMPSKRNLLPDCCSTDPPLLIFIGSLAFIILSFMLLALYIHLVPLPAWELNHKWNRLTMGLGQQAFCLDSQRIEDRANNCLVSSRQFQFSIKAQVYVKRSLFNQQARLAYYSCFNRLNVATDIDSLSVVKNTFFSISLDVSVDSCEPNKTVCEFESDVCVGVSSTDEIMSEHLKKLDIVPRPPNCATSPPLSHTQSLLPMVLHPNASLCEQTQVKPLLQPSNNWQLSRIFKDAFPLINLSLTQQDKMLAVRHLLAMALIFLLVLACGIAYIIRASFVCRHKQ